MFIRVKWSTIFPKCTLFLSFYDKTELIVLASFTQIHLHVFFPQGMHMMCPRYIYYIKVRKIKISTLICLDNLNFGFVQTSI